MFFAVWKIDIEVIIALELPFDAIIGCTRKELKKYIDYRNQSVAVQVVGITVTIPLQFNQIVSSEIIGR